MSEHEVQEHIEHAHHKGEKGIGLTTALWAVLLAVATLSSHRAHTTALLQQTGTVDKWAYYQAKHGRAYLFAGLAELAMKLPNGNDIAQRDLKKSIDEECGAPVEKGCSSPIKDSPELNELLAAMKSGGAAKAGGKTEAHEAEAQAGAAPEKQGKAENEEQGASKEGKPVKARKDGAQQVQEQAEAMEKKTQVAEEKANYFDGGELFLELSIVLCSISLLSDNKLYWKISFASTAIGVVFVVWGFLLR